MFIEVQGIFLKRRHILEQFELNTKIIMGGNVFADMLEKRKRVFIVTDKFMHESGRTSYLTEHIAKNADYFIFSEVTPDPDIQIITVGVEKIINFKPDILVALGGGSPIDAAKAIMFFARKQFKLEDCPFVAIPTTSGTGSEVTKFSVITDSEKGVKYPLIDKSLLPDYAVLDAQLTLSVPPSITADTGIDVLTHAIEAFVCTEANDFTDSLAEKAIKLVNKYLLTAYKEPNNKEARQKMHNASCLAGAAFSNAGLGLCHSMAHAIGAQAHIPHGRANAILLPYVMSYNAGCETKLTKTAERYAQISDSLGLGSSSIRQSALNLINMVRRLEKNMKMPMSLKEAGVCENDFEKMLDNITEAAMADRCMSTTPIPCTHETVKALYRQAFTKSSRYRAL